jgi:tellurite methyltransferase
MHFRYSRVRNTLAGMEQSRSNASVSFFDTQFRRQVEAHDFELNPFERVALGYLSGEVLDFGCGLGNLALEAARSGHPCTAVDASGTAIQRIRSEAERERLPVQAIQADLGAWVIAGTYDTVVSIGLLMFFPRERALELLERLKAVVRPGGRAIVNVLIEGTSYMEMFSADHSYLFRPGELESLLDGWAILEARQDEFAAPAGTVKVFSTVVAQRQR